VTGLATYLATEKLHLTKPSAEKDNQMRTGILAGAFLMATVSSAQAEIAVVQDHYKTVINKQPYEVQVCTDRTVSGDKSGDMLRGAIIGGIIGNNVTKNVENGGAVGALLGGIIGHNNSVVENKGTARFCTVETRYNESQAEVYSHSTVRFTHNGRSYSLRFTK
tara:strand:+ start:3923 stop:4414 length:492 start_codon:yes stop_codon:yes gene_type:complete